MRRKKTRAPGGGRKPLNPNDARSAKVMVRIEPDLLRKIERLAKKHRSNRSKEIRAALKTHIRQYHHPELHVRALTCMIAILMTDIERYTGKKWIDDPLTGTAVREQIDRLIFHFAPIPAEPLTVPPEISQITGKLITVAEMFRPEPNMPQAPSDGFGDDWALLARMIEDLGSGWQRNRAVWLKGMQS